ncbi:MAG: shikimate kinase [Bacteroidales bacterium]|nr:shikimate kinase [Bacteroidales bacterium]
MIISLIGFMGCGKSSVGRRLSELLCCSFMDLDDVIVEAAGRSIPEIFASDGEAEFRRMERDALEVVFNMQETRQSALSPDLEWQNTDHILQTDTQHDQTDAERISAVLALGGGTVMTPECAEMVREHTLCVYLRASVDTLVSHLEGESSGRPILQGNLRQRIEDLMARRSSTYENTAHVIIDTDGKSVSDIAKEISGLTL